MLTRDELSTAFAKWGVAWNEHDLDGVMDLFHDEIYFRELDRWLGQRQRESASGLGPLVCQSWGIQVYGRRDLHRRGRTKNALPLAARLSFV